MSSQKFSAADREAIWLAHKKKCAYTQELLDISSFHIDHIVPESLIKDPATLENVKIDLALPTDFSIFDWGNLLPCRPGANLQKGALILDKARIHFFLGIAESKKAEIESHLKKIEKRNIRGKAIILLQQCLERGELSAQEIARILQEHSEQPEHIFNLIEGLQFIDQEEVSIVLKSEIDALQDRPIRLGKNNPFDGVTLTNHNNETRFVQTCREYEQARQEGYFAYTSFAMKMSTWFEHTCGLLKSLQVASTPEKSFISSPRVGILDLELLPFSMFPRWEKTKEVENSDITYQDKVNDGTIQIKRTRQNLLQVEEKTIGQVLTEVARADFNGDGIEDLLLFECFYATRGSFKSGSIRIITRDSANSYFAIVEPVAPASCSTKKQV